MLRVLPFSFPPSACQPTDRPTDRPNQLTVPDAAAQSFDNPKTYLVHDPNNSLFLGDVVAITPGWRVSTSKRHVVKHIIAPGSGVPIDERPPIPSWEELHAERQARRADKAVRRQVARTVSGAEVSLTRGRELLKGARAELSRLAGKPGVEFEGLKEVDKTANAGEAK